LKYCERCGSLWLRPKGSDLIFCAACARAMAGLVPLWPLGPQVASIRRPEEDAEWQKAFWGEGGNA
jgi:hypothetical protein